MDLKNTNSDDFLKGFKKENPFKTPDHYFNNVSEHLGDLQSLNSKVSDTGYKVPENYFNDFKIKHPFKVIKLLPYISVAAMAIIGLFIFKNINITSQQTLVAELNEEEIFEYLAYEDDIALEEIITYSDALDLEYEDLNTEF